MSTENIEVISETETSSSEAANQEILVVASKVKKLVKQIGGLNTSADCIEALSAKVIQVITQGIETAKSSGRKTLMGRDIA